MAEDSDRGLFAVNIARVLESLEGLADHIEFLVSDKADDPTSYDAWEHRENAGVQFVRLRALLNNGVLDLADCDLATLEVLRDVWRTLETLEYGSHHDRPSEYCGPLFLPGGERLAHERYDPYPELRPNLPDAVVKGALAELEREAESGGSNRTNELAHRALRRVNKPHLSTKRAVWSRLPDELRKLSARLRVRGHANDSKTSTEAPTIPAEYRTRTMTKKKAASYLRPGNPDSAVEWLSKCIEDGIISCESLSRQSHVFDKRQFPEGIRANL